MFKKIVSNLPFSPTLIGELGFYAKRLKKEEATRRIGLILTALALIVQSLAVFSPPESANASNAGDLVHGGFRGRTDMLAACNNNTQGFRDLAARAGITCQNLANSKFGEVHSRVGGKDAGWLSWNRASRFGLERGERKFTISGQTIYVRPLAAFDIKNTTGNGSYYKAFIGKTSSNKDYAIMIDCANIMLKEYPENDKPPAQTPIYTCNSITAVPSPNNKYTYNFTINGTSSGGAKVYDYLINYGVGQPAVHSQSNKFSYTYKKPGQYNIQSSIRFDIGGKVELKTSPGCSTTISIKEDPPKKILVCELASKKMVDINENDFDSSRHSKNPQDCQEKPVPLAVCSSLASRQMSRTRVELSASASVANGATISGYTFIFRDKDGKELFRQKVNSTAASAKLQKDLENPGTYFIEVVASTSVGDKSADACKTTFTVEPPEKCLINPALPANHPDCQPCPADPTLWVKDNECSAQVIRRKSALNITTNKDATSDPAKPSDRIEYTLTVSNDGKADAKIDIEDDLNDTLEYSSLYDRGGGDFDEKNKILSWKGVSLSPGEKTTRTYVVQVSSSVSSMARGASDPTSFDCRMTNHFGNTTDVYIDCPTPKVIEQIVPDLPRTGPTENIIFGGILAAVVTFLYMRSRQLNKEVKLVRREVTAGSI